MKVKIILILCLFISFLSEAQTFFKEGIKWEIKTIGISSEIPSYGSETVILKNVENTDSLAMYSYKDEDISTLSFVAYIKSEGEKVFFKLKEETSSEWYLFYDFGLAPGEGCYVYHLFSLHSNEPGKTYLKCVNIEKDMQNNSFELMKLEKYSDDTCSMKYEDEDVAWIKGLGSVCGVTYNYSPIIGIGFSSKLLYAYDNSELIYSSQFADVKELGSNAPSNIKIDGLNVTLNSSEKDSVAIFNISGECIRQYNLCGENTTISLPEPGVYILKLRDKTYKICVAN